MAATMLSATVLSPWLGSWRWVMLFFGVPCVGLGLLWLTTREPDTGELPAAPAAKMPFKEAIARVARKKEVWLVGLTTTCLWGATMGMVGYLPLYLRNIGWTPAGADSVITVFSGVTAIGVVPMVLLSDKIRSRKTVVFISIVAIIVTLALIPKASTAGIWALVVACGFLRSGGSALFNVIIFEVEGIGGTYGGTATGLANTISMVGAFLGPPLGNSLAEINAGYPFYFWAALATAALPMVFFIKNRTGQLLSP
jgi:predicted MFS family arabinose efflux permease